MPEMPLFSIEDVNGNDITLVGNRDILRIDLGAATFEGDQPFLDPVKAAGLGAFLTNWSRTQLAEPAGPLGGTPEPEEPRNSGQNRNDPPPRPPEPEKEEAEWLPEPAPPRATVPPLPPEEKPATVADVGSELADVLGRIMQAAAEKVPGWKPEDIDPDLDPHAPFNPPETVGEVVQFAEAMAYAFEGARVRRQDRERPERYAEDLAEEAAPWKHSTFIFMIERMGLVESWDDDSGGYLWNLITPDAPAFVVDRAHELELLLGLCPLTGLSGWTEARVGGVDVKLFTKGDPINTWVGLRRIDGLSSIDVSTCIPASFLNSLAAVWENRSRLRRRPRRFRTKASSK